MSEDRTGSVRFNGDPNTYCIEAQPYNDGSALLEPGDVLEDMPEYDLKRFLVNADFEPAGGAASEVADELAASAAVRINGAVVNEELAPADQQEDAKPLEKQTKAELKETAERKGVEVNDSMTKAEMVEALSGGEGGDGEHDPLKDTTASETAPPPEGNAGPNEGGNA